MGGWEAWLGWVGGVGGVILFLENGVLGSHGEEGLQDKLPYPPPGQRPMEYVPLEGRRSTSHAATPPHPTPPHPTPTMSFHPHERLPPPLHKLMHGNTPAPILSILAGYT